MVALLHFQRRRAVTKFWYVVMICLPVLITNDGVRAAQPEDVYKAACEIGRAHV